MRDLGPPRPARRMDWRCYYLLTALAVAALAASPVIALIAAGQEMLSVAFFALLAAALGVFALGLRALRATQPERLRRSQLAGRQRDRGR